MGTALYKEEPAFAASEVFQHYDKALELLACRILAEPYNAHQVEAEIQPAMLIGTFGEVILECQKQFRESRRYSPQTVAMALNRDRASLQNWTQRDTEIDLPAAWEMFRHIYGQWVEQQIAESVAGWIRDGLSTEEIKTQGDKVRKDKGISARVVVDDGKAEFQKELVAALDGKVIEYPVRPPLDSLRFHIPFFEPGEYCIVAGRTGMGKSYFAQNCIHYAARQGIQSVYLNLENKPKHMQKRLWQMETGAAFQRDMRNITDKQRMEYVEAWEKVSKYPTRIFNPGRQLQQVTNAIRSEYYDRGVQLAVVDYIQLLRANDRRGRVDELAEISAELRALALELDLPIIVLAQMNRESEKNGDKRPSLTGIRSSGDLEQDATSVLLLYRPGYYEIHADDEGNPYPPEYADIHIAKGRETGPGFAKCRFNAVKGFYDPIEQVFSNTPPPLVQDIPAGARPGWDEDVPF